jgi:hypothetical protein
MKGFDERWGLIAIVAGCAIWILAHDIAFLFPVLGIIGGLMALYRDEKQ